MTVHADLASLALRLQQTLDPATRSDAEKELAANAPTQGFPLMLLKLVESGASDTSVRFAAALYFKNLVKRLWKQSEGEPNQIAESDRQIIKSMIVPLMISVPQTLQVQLGEAVSIIADSDFPDNWQNLLGDLVARLNLEDLVGDIGVLQTAHSIFKRWRHQFRSNALFAEIKFALEQFAPAYLEVFKAINAQVDANAGNKPVLEKLFEIVLLLCKIFYSFNCLELPEFFEDHQQEFMDMFAKYLVYSNPVIESAEDEAGPIERVKSMVCEIVDLYARLYEEDFKRMPEFVQTIWTLLTTTGPEPKNDVLVSRMLHFLASVVSHPRNSKIFSNPQTLQSICHDIILPNMRLRPSDEELFEDDPIEFIRRDLEGSDSDTRRSAAAELVRGLLEYFAQETTQIFAVYITKYLETYQSSPATNWQAKDTALFLITSLSAKALTTLTGATATNEFIPILDVFATHVLPELQSPVDGAVHPIVKVDCIKYLTVFRGQLTKPQILEILPSIANNLASSNFVVHTWAAHAIERIFAMRAGNSLLFTPADVAALSGPILNRLFDLIEAGGTPQKMSENDYLVKCAMRTIAISRDKTADVMSVLTRLMGIIMAISQNPSNPRFTHFAFESLGLLVRFVCGSNPAVVSEFESFISPYFGQLLQNDVVEFLPYVFQILAQMLALHTAPGLPESYQGLLSQLLMPASWESQGNVPALVGLLQSCIFKGANDIVAAQKLVPILGVCQKLLSSRLNDNYGFELLVHIFEHIPPAALIPYLPNIFVVLLTRLTQSKTAKFSSGFLNFMCSVFMLERPELSADVVIGVLDSLQATPLFGGLMQGVLLPELAQVAVPADRKRCVVGMACLLTQSNAMISGAYASIWPEAALATVTLADQLSSAETTTKKNSGEDVDVLAVFDNDESAGGGLGYQASYVQLATVSQQTRDARLAHVHDAGAFLAQMFARMDASIPGGRIMSVVNQKLTPEACARVHAYVQRGAAELCNTGGATR